jgi:hypothetical protein
MTVPEFGVMVNAPLMIPFVVGVKLTANVHLAFAFSVPLQGFAPLPTAEKSPLVADVKVTDWLWLLVSVMFCEGAVEPTLVAAKVRFPDNDIASCPLPVRLTTCGEPTAVSLTVMAPGIEPVTVGEKVTVMLQNWPGVSVTPVQLVIWE